MHDANTELCHQVFETHKRVMELALELNDITDRTQARLVHQKSVAIEAWLEAARNEWQGFADAAGPLDLVSLQVDVAADLSERVLANIQELIDIQLQAHHDVLQCLREVLASNATPSSWEH